MQNFFSLIGLLHTSHPSFINTCESFSLKGHLFGNITTSKDRLQASPKSLHFDPKIKDLRCIWESSNKLFDLFFERSDMSLSVCRTQNHLILLKFLGDLSNTKTSENNVFSFTPVTELELFCWPILGDFRKIDLNFLLFFSRLSYLLNIFNQIKHSCLNKVFNCEDLRLIVRNSVVSRLHSFLVESLPMSIFDCIFFKNCDYWQ